MAQAALPILLAIVVLVIGAVILVRFAQRREGRAAEIKESGAPTLRYEVPDGMDPVAVLTALKLEGYDAVDEPGTVRREVVIACPSGADRERERVRTTIANAANPEGDVIGERHVRFTDESA